MRGSGKIIGRSPSGVVVYSNYRNRNPTTHKKNGIYYGQSWQCIEYARRYWIEMFGVTFKQITNAYELMKITFCTAIHTGKKEPVKVCHNHSPYQPLIGSLLVWMKDSKNQYGHVAVITGITPTYIHITQQNKKDVHRRIPWYYHNGYVIDDPHVLGWITPKQYN